MNAVGIKELVVQTTDSFRQNGYTERSVKEKRRILLKIVSLHEKRGESSYSSFVIAEFAQESKKRFECGNISRIYYRFLTKTASYLTEFHNSGTLKHGKQFIVSISNYYDEILDNILVHDGWNRKSNHSYWSFAKTFFKWLISNGHADLSKVNEAVARAYLIDCASRMTGSSIDTARRTLKCIFAYLHEMGLCDDSFDRLFSFPVPFERKMKKVIPQEEIAVTLNMIDRATVIGRRDYAAILLATVTGLRSIDICNLKLDDIDWRNGEIKIIQSKTGKSLALPLTADVGTAMQDYILNARPANELSNVFLRSRGPIKEINPATLHAQHRRYRLKAGLHERPFRDLRRTIGTNMIISGTPIATVAQVLGHSDIDSTRQYISLDSKHLKDCALNFTGIEKKHKYPVKGGVVQ